MVIAEEAARLRQAARDKPLKLPVNRRIDDRHHALTKDGLNVWFTIQIAPHRRIYEALFERDDRPPDDGEVMAWLGELMSGLEPAEAPGLPGAHSRRFEVFQGGAGVEVPSA
jgi:hypothetical protein